MNRFKLLSNLISMACLLFLLSGTAFALNIQIYNPADVGNLMILEDFESYDADIKTEASDTGWYDSLETGIGTFTATGSAGTGQTSYNQNKAGNAADAAKFSIQSTTERGSNWYGRYNTTPGQTTSKWLDSGDITGLTLALADGFSNIFNSLYFYMMDPSDCSATTTVEGITRTTSLGFSDFLNPSNSKKYLVGITWDDSETLESITWSTTNTSDGYGLDDFATAAPVPEPATMMLFGIGLIGLAGIARRRT